MKIRGNTVGTTLRPDKALVKATKLTEEEKAQARENIGAVSANYFDQTFEQILDDINRTVDSTVRHDEAQDLTDEQKAQARANIGAAAEGETGGGGIPVPSTAEVGQTVVVKSVDENGKPTAWEAADLPSGGSGGETFELIASGELTEETTTINITADNNGNAFRLLRAQFMIKIVGTATNTADRGNLRIRHNYNTAAKGSSVVALQRIRNSELTCDLYGVYEFFPDIPWGVLYYPTPANSGNTHLYANYDTDWDNSPYLSALYLYGETANANTMGVGTKWELWGVRA